MSCAEQSTVSETLNAVSAKNVVEMQGFIEQVYREHSLCYQHDYKKNWLLLDVDLTGMVAGKKAEGSEKGYFSGERNGRGRQVGRVYASQFLDGYWTLIKVKNWKRTQKLVKTVQTWCSLPELPGHAVGWVGRPHAYEKASRQLAIRWPKEKGGFHYCVLVFNLTDLMIFQLAGLLMPRKLTEPDLFSAILKAYNLRSGGVETSIKNSKQGLGLNKRNKKRFDAQHMLLLLAQLAYNIAVWVRNQLARHSATIASFGMLRLIRDAFHISGKLQVDEKGNVNLIILNQAHKLAKVFQDTWRASFPCDDLSLILGKI
jgi:hypothetical protein